MNYKKQWIKKGLIVKQNNYTDWWQSHTMAPTAIKINNDIIRIYLGCFDKFGISRISFIDINSQNPKDVKNISNKIILNLGDPGCFDDNGVFPAHAYKIENKVYLYYTGFQLLHKIPFSNFGGLALSNDGGNTFQRISKAPVMDRTDEGLFTRAGNSIIIEDDVYHCCYSAGSSWKFVNGKNRPVYDVYYIKSNDGIYFNKKGKRIINANLSNEHGLGRPQIVKLFDKYYIFYTRRMLDFKYFIGAAISDDLVHWKRIDNWFDNINFGNSNEFDSDMIYFPSVLQIDNKVYLFYSGNNFGQGGLGFLELE